MAAESARLKEKDRTSNGNSGYHEDAEESTPEAYSNLDEVLGPAPNQNPDDQEWTRHESLEERRAQQ